MSGESSRIAVSRVYYLVEEDSRPAEGTRARFVVVKERTSREFGWLLGKERRHESNSPSNGATAGFLCGQIGGHYAPKLGLNCGSGNESGCSNATAHQHTLCPETCSRVV
ncbi:hypothetical protein K0M31_001355 [Melipona bicolor]|uniref:Uncharacterized protein n=1 Tax=Melipona bicolor TaxID=60889 RepID=A0AA40KXK2_9HYME|nr:hypothetical protein K0M31_001355 [Melipona bicolor]